MLLVCLLIGHRWRLFMRYSWKLGHALPVADRCARCGMRRPFFVNDFTIAR